MTNESDKKRLAAFVVLNPFYSYFYAVKNRYVHESMLPKFDQALTRILMDDEVYFYCIHYSRNSFFNLGNTLRER